MILRALKKLGLWVCCYLYFVGLYWDKKDKRHPRDKWREAFFMGAGK